MNTKLKSILAFTGMMMILPVNAQQIIVETADTTITSNHLFTTPNGEYTQLAFNAKGVATYSCNTIKEKANTMLILQDGTMYVMVCEPKKTQKLKLERNKTGKVIGKLSGANADMAELFTEYTKFSPVMDYNEETSPADIKKKSTEASNKLDEQYKRLVILAKKLKNKEDVEQNLVDIEKAYLKNRLSLLENEDYLTHRDPREDNRVMQLVAEIDPNDTLSLSNDLITSFIYAHFPERITKDMSAENYGIGYINTVDKYVTNKKIRDLLMEGIINNMLGTTTPFNIDAFWQVAKEKVDPSIIERFQYIVDAKKNTKAGMKCPDITFSDAEGNKHHLSEFKGKMVYIDLWATWCGPCAMEIPKLAKHIEEYQGNNKVEFISISLDENMKAWKNRIAKEKLQWPQFIANAEENKMISKTFGVMSIPRFLLINADGTINDADAFRPSDEKFKEKLDAALQ